MKHYHAFYENEGYGGDIIDVNLPCPATNCPRLEEAVYLFTPRQLIDSIPLLLESLADEIEAGTIHIPKKDRR
jgi:hypothetical protein